jgi:hypothetical protein
MPAGPMPANPPLDMNRRQFLEASLVITPFPVVSEDEGQWLDLFKPAGNREDFLQQVAQFGPALPNVQDASWRKLGRQHGMEEAGPPLPF